MECSACCEITASTAGAICKKATSPSKAAGSLGYSDLAEVIERARADIANGEVQAFPLRFTRSRYRLNEVDARRLRDYLLSEGLIVESSGNRLLVA